MVECGCQRKLDWWGNMASTIALSDAKANFSEIVER